MNFVIACGILSSLARRKPMGGDLVTLFGNFYFFNVKGGDRLQIELGVNLVG